MIEKIDTSRDGVRKTGKAFLFAGSILAAFLFLGHSHGVGWTDWNWCLGLEGNAWKWLIGSGLVLFGASYLFFPVMKPVHVVWMVLAHVWGWAMTRIVLSLFFFVILTPIGWVIHLSGKDLLGEEIEPGAVSYWRQRRKQFESRHMERQF